MCGSVLASRRLPLLLCIASSLLPACKEQHGPPLVVSVHVSPGTVTIASLGEVFQLMATARDASGRPLDGRAFTWTSDDSLTAAVDGSGLVTARADGAAKITAATDGVSGSATVTVLQAVAHITVSPSRDTLVSLGETRQMEAIAQDARGNVMPEVAVSWNSHPATVAHVTPSGLVRALANGSAIVYAHWYEVADTAGVVVDQRPVRLSFEQFASNLPARAPMVPPVIVGVFDALGSPVGGESVLVTLELLSNPFGAALAGTASVGSANGRSVFSDVAVDRAGRSLTLVARAVSVTPDSSGVFDVVLNGSSISAGHEHSCAAASQLFYCWGKGSFGRLGNGDTVSAPVPDSVSSAGDLAATMVTAGDLHSCGVVSSGAAYCWGSNALGALGDGSTDDSAVPVLVAGVPPLATVGGGSHYSCALSTTGDAYCWGDNSYGQLGNGGSGPTPVPTIVAGGTKFATISVGMWHTCAVSTSAVGYCWGHNARGQLGDGTTTHAAVPTPVNGGLAFEAIAAGWAHSCGIAVGGRLYCWGYNGSGALGNGTTTSSNVPVAVSGGLTFAQVAANSERTCGLTTRSEGFCWGRDALGSAERTSSVPIPVAGQIAFRSLDTGVYHNCGIATDGAMWCWGGNSGGQLGYGGSANAELPRKVAPPIR